MTGLKGFTGFKRLEKALQATPGDLRFVADSKQGQPLATLFADLVAVPPVYTFIFVAAAELDLTQCDVMRILLTGPHVRIGICQDGRHAVTEDASALSEARHFQRLFSHYMQHPVECV